jgi:hypothetical protein
MEARSPEEEHRPATPLELLFDLVFVVAVARASSQLHHGIADAHVGDAIVGYAMVFFGIWWAWMNFTWFASAYDTDDIAYRLAVFVQLVGALIFAAGVDRPLRRRPPHRGHRVCRDATCPGRSVATRSEIGSRAPTGVSPIRDRSRNRAAGVGCIAVPSPVDGDGGVPGPGHL